MLIRWRKAGLTLPAAAAMAALITLVSLGTWQVQRKVWKETLIAAVAARAAEPPIVISDAIFTTGAGQPLPFTRVTLAGRFLHDKERFWFTDGRLGAGFQVFTPLETAPGKVVWVNRGYVPKALRDPGTREAGQLAGIVRVTGQIRLPGERNAFTPDNDIGHNIWFWRDLPALNASAFTPDVISAPVMVDAEAVPANPGGWPEGGTSIPDLPNRHLEYAVTWYSLALTLIGVFFAFARSRLRLAPQ